MTEPNLDEWKRLYDAAIAFRDLACWRWMWDSDVFAVQDPADPAGSGTQEIGYCSVMGALGEFLALAVYPGGEGFALLDKMHADPIGPADEDPEDPFVAFLEQNCLIASFTSRDDLDKGDLAVIRTLGLRFRGRTAWPQFRSHRPGYAPWRLEAPEARFLTVALEQAVDVGSRCKERRTLLDPPEGREDAILTRVPLRRGGCLAWEDQWLPPAPPSARRTPPAPVVDFRKLDEVERLNLPQGGTWEMDLVPFPAFVGKDERPFIPMLLMCVDHASGLVSQPQMAHPDEVHASLADWITEFFITHKTRPETILFRNPDLHPALKTIASPLGIAIQRADDLPMLSQARMHLRNFLG
ncbi:MAG TPA: hypothetical protein VM492_00860 [Sumerlaeia bacterium]|nr:hypothetical protein [Sumerlaeia bacterium]